MSTNTAATVEPEVVDRLPATSVRVLAVLLVGAFVVILNETALNVALSRIMTDLSIDERTAQWLTTGFMLTMAVVIPITGWLMERFATRTVFPLNLPFLRALRVLVLKEPDRTSVPKGTLVPSCLVV